MGQYFTDFGNWHQKLLKRAKQKLKLRLDNKNSQKNSARFRIKRPRDKEEKKTGKGKEEEMMRKNDEIKRKPKDKASQSTGFKIGIPTSLSQWLYSVAMVRKQESMADI